MKKYHETKIFDEDEIYPYRIEGLGKNLIPTATDFDIIDVFEKVNDEKSYMKYMSPIKAKQCLLLIPTSS